MGSPDPIPALAFPDARRLLQERFGESAVQWDDPFGTVTIRFPTMQGSRRLRRFTWRQAKYLAVNPKVAQEIMLGRYPKDWPSGDYE